MSALLLLGLAVSFQGQTTLGKGLLSLEATTKPIKPIAFLKGWSCITVTDVPRIPGDEIQRFRIRVFRYTRKMDFVNLKRNWDKHFPKAQGWKFAPVLDTPIQFGIDRFVKDPVVRRQALIFSQSKVVYDPDEFLFTRLDPTPGWVRASYNEEYRKDPAKGRVLKRWP